MSPDQQDPLRLEGDTIICRGTESLFPGILQKTLAAMEYCLNTYTFDFLIRTNISSVWNFTELLRLHLPLKRCVLARTIINTHVTPGVNTICPSGCGYILSADVVKQFIDNKGGFVFWSYDDVAIGHMCYHLKLPIIEG
jgi:hypothetical protein